MTDLNQFLTQAAEQPFGEETPIDEPEKKKRKRNNDADEIETPTPYNANEEEDDVGYWSPKKCEDKAFIPIERIDPNKLNEYIEVGKPVRQMIEFKAREDKKTKTMIAEKKVESITIPVFRKGQAGRLFKVFIEGVVPAFELSPKHINGSKDPSLSFQLSLIPGTEKFRYFFTKLDAFIKEQIATRPELEFKALRQQRHQVQECVQPGKQKVRKNEDGSIDTSEDLGTFPDFIRFGVEYSKREKMFNLDVFDENGEEVPEWHKNERIKAFMNSKKIKEYKCHIGVSIPPMNVFRKTIFLKPQMISLRFPTPFQVNTDVMPGCRK